MYINDLLGDRQQIYQVFIPLTGVPGIQSTLTGQPLTSAEIYQTSPRSQQARGVLGQRAIQREDLAIHGIQPSPGYPLRIGFRVADDTVNGYSQQGKAASKSSARSADMCCPQPTTSTGASTSYGLWT